MQVNTTQKILPDVKAAAGQSTATKAPSTDESIFSQVDQAKESTAAPAEAKSSEETKAPNVQELIAMIMELFGGEKSEEAPAEEAPADEADSSQEKSQTQEQKQTRTRARKGQGAGGGGSSEEAAASSDSAAKGSGKTDSADKTDSKKKGGCK